MLRSGVTMRELMQSTRRIRRRWLDRLRGCKRLFGTEITGGEYAAYGRGPTPEASQKSAQRAWDAELRKKPGRRTWAPRTRSIGSAISGWRGRWRRQTHRVESVPVVKRDETLLIAEVATRSKISKEWVASRRGRP
jgi:hypothetical protein